MLQISRLNEFSDLSVSQAFSKGILETQLKARSLCIKPSKFSLDYIDSTAVQDFESQFMRILMNFGDVSAASTAAKVQ